MRLTSQIKELGAILQKLIKYEPGLIQIDDNNEHLALMAMRMNLGQKTSVVGSVQQRNETKLFFHKNWKKWENKAVLNSV